MLGEIGDLIVSLPAVEALKTYYPDARITYVIRRPLTDLVRLNPGVDEVLGYDNSGIVEKLSFVTRLLARKWDLWVDLHTPTHNTWCTNDHVFRRNRLLMRLAGTQYRSGIAVPSLATALTHRHAVPDESLLQTENIVRTTLRCIGFKGEMAPRKRIVLSPEAVRWAAHALDDKGVATRPRIALFFGAKQPSDVWPLNHVSSFIELFAARWPEHALLLIGGPHERQASTLLRDSLARSGIQLVDFVGQTSLLQTGALLQGVEALVSTDSGPMHIADALDVPLVVLFGAKTYLPVWLPQQTKIRILNHRPECSPCFSSVCPHDNLCMRSITPESVVEALGELLNDKT
jgi:ADP-heptose:LPS heptosyltransferase